MSRFHSYLGKEIQAQKCYLWAVAIPLVQMGQVKLVFKDNSNELLFLLKAAYPFNGHLLLAISYFFFNSCFSLCSSEVINQLDVIH